VLFEYDVEVPADTAKASPLELDLVLDYGIIHRVEISFPAGCAGLAHMTVWHEGRQLWPNNPDNSFNADNYTIAWSEFYPLERPPYILKVRAWNRDDTYPHTITLRFAILPRDILQPPRPEVGILERLERALKRLLWMR